MSDYAICSISVACVRQAADDNAVLTTQVLFGEPIRVIERKKRDWYRIECLWDNVKGWIDPKQFHFLKASETRFIEASSTFALEHLHGLISPNGAIPISIGSNLYNCDGINVKLPFGNCQYSGQIVSVAQSNGSLKLLTNIAKRYLHCPHMKGGRSIMGLDATGYVQMVYKLMGISLPRDCAGQALLGVDVGFAGQGEPGDLAFFEKENGVISHVGIVIEKNMVIHVYGKVRIDHLDQQGIFNKTKKRYLFKLRTLRRIATFS